MTTTAKRKVLVVEDAEATWTVQERMLIGSGFDPTICTSGSAALEAIAAGEFDLVVLDLGLPGVDGWAILDRLRTEPSTSTVPVLIVTARDDAETQQKARIGGANALLTKPFDVNKFRQAVEDLVGAA
jgi:CheY-like chemotaxis protein